MDPNVEYPKQASQPASPGIIPIIGVIVTIIIIVGIAGLVIHDHNNNTKTNRPKGNIASSQSQKNGTKSGNSSTTSTPPTTNQSVSSNSASPAPTSSTALSNTGPGNVIGVFLGISLSGGLLHHFYLRRKLSAPRSN